MAGRGIKMGRGGGFRRTRGLNRGEGRQKEKKNIEFPIFIMFIFILYFLINYPITFIFKSSFNHSTTCSILIGFSTATLLTFPSIHFFPNLLPLAPKNSPLLFSLFIHGPRKMEPNITPFCPILTQKESQKSNKHSLTSNTL